MTAEPPSPPWRSARESRYAVIRVGDEWRLLFDGDVLGRFPTQDAATAMAEKLCAASSAMGLNVGLVVQAHNGELRPEVRPCAEVAPPDR